MHCSRPAQPLIDRWSLEQVLGGADLFLQGFILPESGLPQFASGDLMAITIPGNRYPFAVGMMETSSAAVAKSGSSLPLPADFTLEQ